MYHDQGHIPQKLTIGNGKYLLGIPIIRPPRITAPPSTRRWALADARA
jgi:hypothetical protein